MDNNQPESQKTRSRQFEKEGLRERLRFEQLLSDLSARFVNIAPDQVDLEIENALRQILEFFQVDRCGLVRVSPHDNSFRITHVAYASDIPPVPVNSDLSINLFPWVREKIIKRHEVVSFTTRDELPSEAAVDKQTYEELGVRSALNIPIFLEKKIKIRHCFLSANQAKNTNCVPASVAAQHIETPVIRRQ